MPTSTSFHLSAPIEESGLAPERREKIECLRRLIAEDRYDIPPELVADRILELHFLRA